MKNLWKILSLILVLAVMVCALTLITASANEAAAPEIRQNLYYGENIKMMYAVPEGSTALQYRYNRFVLNDNPENANDGKWEWTEWTDAEKYATQNIDNDGNMYDVYMAAGVPAQKLDTIFEVRFVGDEKAVKTYSGLEYLYERLYIDKDEITNDQKNMYESLLTYAGYAQTLLVKYDYTALGSYAYVTTENADQATGIYAGEVTLTPSITKGINQIIVATVNSSPVELANDDSYKLPLEGGKYYEVVFETTKPTTTVSTSIAEYASVNNWADATKYLTIKLDNIITATAAGGTNTGKYYTNGNNWRIYQGEGGTVTFAALNTDIKSVKVSYVSENNGVLTLDGSEIPSDTVVNVEKNSVTFGVENGDEGKGQARITAIEVVYYSVEDCVECAYSEYVSDGNATCNVNGTKTRTCSRCGKTETVTDEGSMSKDYCIASSDYDKDENEHWKVCTVCGEICGEKEQHSPTDAACETCGYVKTEEGGGDTETTKAWTLVTDASNLAVGDQIIIVANNYDFALSTNQKDNNRGAAVVTKNGNVITFNDSDGVQIITLEAGAAEGTFAFYVSGTNTGYLYAAGGVNSNYLRTEASVTTKGSWNISIDSTGVATVKAVDENTNRNILKYYSSTQLFSCYASGQKDICIYKLQ